MGTALKGGEGRVGSWTQGVGVGEAKRLFKEIGESICFVLMNWLIGSEPLGGKIPLVHFMLHNSG